MNGTFGILTGCRFACTIQACLSRGTRCFAGTTVFLRIFKIKAGWSGIGFAFFLSIGADAFACIAGHAHGTENIAGTTVGIVCLQIDAHRRVAVAAIRQPVLADTLAVIAISPFGTFVIACAAVVGIVFGIETVGIFLCTAVDESFVAFAFVHALSVFADFIGIVARSIAVTAMIPADL